MHPSTIARYAPVETARPQGQPVAGTTADQTVTEAGFYKFFSYTSGYYYIVSNSAINVFPQYNTGNYIIGGHQYCYYFPIGFCYSRSIQTPRKGFGTLKQNQKCTFGNWVFLYGK